MSNNKNFTWVETNMPLFTSETVNAIKYDYELILNKCDYNICFYGHIVKLQAQEYKFLKAILSKNGKKISALKLMSEIDSKCNPNTKSRQNSSYKIKNHIEYKIYKSYESPQSKNEYEFYLPISPTIKWKIIDSVAIYDNPKKYSKIEKYQIIHLRVLLNLLIRVKEGKYYTSFVKGCKPNKK